MYQKTYKDLEEHTMISIITPTFNSEKTIIFTLESILNQTYENYEYIIVDGGSTDKTMEVIQEYYPRFSGRMRYISEKDNGIGDAMNKGIKMAKGEIIGFLNADDYYEKDCLISVAKAYNPNTKYQVIYGEMRTIDSEGRELSVGIFNHCNLRNTTMNFPSAFFSSSIFSELFLFDEKNYKLAIDYEMFVNCFESKKVVFSPVYVVLSNFRLGGASGSIKCMQEFNMIRYRHGYISRKNYIVASIALWIKSIFKR